MVSPFDFKFEISNLKISFVVFPSFKSQILNFKSLLLFFLFQILNLKFLIFYPTAEPGVQQKC